MTSLIFHDLPSGPVPLYVGEPCEGVFETGTLLLDHVGREVRWVMANPYAPFVVADHDIHRFSWWDVDAMMPRWQLRELYGEARPLMERIQMGTTMTRMPTHWSREQTREAEATNALVDELTERRAETPIDWVPSLRPVRNETALERAIRLDGGVSFEVARAQFLAGMAETEDAYSRDPLYSEFHEAVSRNRMPFQKSGSPGKSSIFNMLHVSDLHYPISTVVDGGIVSSTTQGKLPQHMARRSRSVILPGNHDRYSRKGNGGGIWGRLFESRDTDRSAG